MPFKSDDGPINILGVGVSAVNMHTALAQISHWISSNDHQYVCVANVHTITESYRDARLRRINNRAGMVTPDGMPLVWASRSQGYKNVSRVYGPDLLLAACDYSVQTGWSHYFYGGAPGVAERLVERLCARYPGLNIAGWHSPPFHALSAAEEQVDIARINASGAQILWVGLGAPKQEVWMADHLGRMAVPVMIGVGAAFDFHAGVKKQAPGWMQKTGLEWLYRLASEPRRLWKRYLINNPMFLYLYALQRLGIKKMPLE